MDADSFNEHLDARALAFIKNAETAAYGSHEWHTGDTYHSPEWSRSNDVASFPCCGRKVSSSFSSLVGKICRLLMDDQPAER